MGLIPGSGRSPGEGYGNLLQYSCLENLMAQGAWRAIIHRVAKSWAQLKWMNTHTRTHMLLEISLWKIIKLWYDIVVRQMVFTTRLTGFESWIHHFIGCMLFKKEKTNCIYYAVSDLCRGMQDFLSIMQDFCWGKTDSVVMGWGLNCFTACGI